MLTSAASASVKAETNINLATTTFRQKITRYLQGGPDDLFTWLAGYRIRHFAAHGLVQPIDTRLWRWPRRDGRPADW
ncbi:hypothetical protein OG782_02570 [Streptomyces sp. NBC_00876]|uniref:hypothetical protein n=1 Tax=Streptomyces sp. NBC_00876 TaxID=2975853 RepID=UPI003870E263|nr:hypothetical protein OG782_02570 [Streptomyces sp. NBC_00876]